MVSINLPSSVTGQGVVTTGRKLRMGTSRFLGPGSFIVYKLLASLYCLFWCIWWPARDRIKAYLFLNFWTFYVATAYFFLSLFSAVVVATALRHERAHLTHHGDDPKKEIQRGRTFKGPPVPWQIRYLQHFTWSVACISSLVVVTVFWTTIYDGSPLTTVDYNIHAVIPCLMVLDQLLIATDYKCRAFWLTEYYAIVYIFFNLGWYYEKSRSERVLYEVMDWEVDPGRATLLTFIILCGLIPAASVFHSMVCQTREWIFKTCMGGSSPSGADGEHAAAPAPAPASAAPTPAPAPASASATKHSGADMA